ncbi:hypothetical protein CSB07_01500 [Candidatus Gracilibacteria bacterium]|nr:MAG: hypothetical protein CSB07_01500 [Candidatus Gracilibacteria bacterium]
MFKLSLKMKKILFILMLIFILFNFYKINLSNYSKSKEIQDNLVKHPENLPTKEFALKTSFGFKNVRADIYRLKTIQYIGSNAVSSEYKKYLYFITDLITELNPNFKHPYIVSELLLPSTNHNESLNVDVVEKHINEAEKIGLKGIKNFCDEEKIEKIKDEYDLNKIWILDKYRKPCSNYQIPYYLAYIYYFYKKDPLKSSLYYKVASASNTELDGIKVMAAIMQGKGGNREKSFFMFLNIARTIENENETCNKFSSDLEKAGVQIFKKNYPLNGKFIKDMGDWRNKLFGKFNPDKELEELSDTKCSNYINKAVRELNLYYLEKANEKFKKNNNGLSARNAKVLFNQGYIDYLPIDFQQYEEQGIIYEYNPDTGFFDYEMGKYDN